MHGGRVTTTRVRVTRLAADLEAIRRQHGLEMLVGSPAVAFHLGQQEELLKPLGPEETFLVCDGCAMAMTLAEVWMLEERRAAGVAP